MNNNYMSFTIGSTHLTYNQKNENFIKLKSRNKIYSVEFCKTKISPVNNDILIIDRKVDELYNLSSESSRVFFIDAVEKNKNMDGVMELLEYMSISNIKKSDTLHVVGGGITQDISGMAASMYKRGVPWTYTPTTLLSMCDSSIGSKVNVNLGRFKNQLGTMYPPDSVFINTDYLETLKREDVHSGIGEMLKLYTIADIKWESKNIKDSIKTCLNIKKAFIEEDEYEETIRPILNYGHTFGHVFETMSNFKVPHGIAVLLGMYVVDAYFGQCLTKYQPFMDIIKKYTHFIVRDEELFFNALRNDKKVDGNVIKLIRVNEGHCNIVDTILDINLVKHVYSCIDKL